MNKPNSPVDQSEELLKKLLEVPTPTAPPPARAPDVTPLEVLTPAEPPGLEALLQTYFTGQQSPRPL